MFGIEKERRSFASPLDQGGFKSFFSQGHIQSDEQNAPFLSSFFIELIDRIKNSLGSVKNYTQISRGKFSDKEFGEYYSRAVAEDIEKIDIILSSLINYIKLHMPIRKIDTVHKMIEEVLKKHQAKFVEKGIKLFKKFEKDLPETIVPDEQLKYIFSSVLQYAIDSTPPHLNIGLSTRSFNVEKEGVKAEDVFQRDGRYIEILVVFAGYKKPMELVPGIATLQKEEASDLILRFVKEVVLRNHGTMKMGTDGKKTKTFISLRFPVERRKVVSYQSVN